MTVDRPSEATLPASRQLHRDGSNPIEAYENLLARNPNLPDAWYNLGNLLSRAGRFEDALAAYRQALARGIDRPEEVHMNMSVIYAAHLQNDDAAKGELETALRLRPDFVPALFNLGSLEENRGNRTGARALYERILALDPLHCESLARLANTHTSWSADDPLISQLQRALALPNATASQRASLGFALGNALDGSNAYDAAFKAYADANRASRETAGTGIALYDRHAHEKFIAQLMNVFPLASRSSPSSASQKPPIFICGMFRSGSTLTEQILAGHPRVTAGGELDLLPNLARAELSPFPSSVTQIAPALLDGIAERYLRRVSELFPAANLVTDKRPQNFLYIGLIKTLFPDAKIVNTTRHPLDNCLSTYFLNLDHSAGYALDLLDIGHYYRQYRRLMDHWKTHFGADILDLDYDALVREPRPQIARLLEFGGLDWDEACLSFDRNDNSVRTASAWQVREPLYRRSSGRWRNYERQLAPLRDYLSDLMPDSVG